MSRNSKNGPAVRRVSWRKMAWVSASLAGLLGAGYGVRLAFLPRAGAQPAADASNAAPAPATEIAPVPTDYGRRVVAYLNDNEPVTREELGEYLILRHGPEKLEVLVNKRIIDAACRQYGLEVTAAEVEAAFAEELRSLNMDVATFVKNFLSRYKQNLYEWKEDVIRPRLLLTKLCRNTVQATAEDLQHAFEAHYGEKVECRIILYPNSKEGEEQAKAEYAKVRDGGDGFDQAARKQYLGEYGAAGGKIKPFGRYEMEDPELDNYAFRLHDGEVSQAVHTRQGFAVLQCLKHLPAETSRTLDSVKDALTKEIMEKKVAAKMKELVPELKRKAQVQILLKRSRSGNPPEMPEGSGPPKPNQVVAWYNGNVPVTREELGEYLIACYGAEKLEYMVNERIIVRECAARGITVTLEEIQAALRADLQKLHVDESDFVKQFLATYRTNLWTYCEDVVRQRLVMTKLSQDRVKITDDDLRKAFDAYYGEKVECRIILWPPDQTKFALTEYPKIRDSEAAFAEAAKRQASGTLAAHGGRIEPFARHTLGDDNLEEAAFNLKPGDVSTLVGTPQGNVVIKCDRRYPPKEGVTLEQVRPEMERAVRERKVQLEMGVVFREMRDRAHPNLLLKDANRPINVTEETRGALAEVQDLIRPPANAAQGKH
jgi:parvulin-like peptidyl-prolyl isomerase